VVPPASLAHLPAVAVRTLEHRVPPERRETVELGRLIDQAGRQEHAPRANRSRPEVAALAGDRADWLITNRHVRILRQLRPGLAAKVRRCDAVAAHEVVHL